MELQDQILNLLGSEDYVPVRPGTIPTLLKLGPKEAKQAIQLLDQMLENGEIARLKKDKICLPDDADLVSGKILFRQNGAAKLVTDANNKKASVSAPGY